MKNGRTDTVTIRLFAATALISLAATAQSHALSSPWEETDGGRLRVVVGSVDPATNTARGFLDLDLQPGWKTYWREPGFSGIPPVITIDGSLGATGLELHFPAPQWLETKDGNFAGYAQPVRLPFTVSMTQGKTKGMMNASVFVGICKEICIPASAEFILPLAADSGDKDQADIDMAFTTLPDATSIVASPQEAQADGSVLVRLDWPDATAKPPVLFAADKNAKVTFSHPEFVSSSNGTALFKVHPARPKMAETVETVLTLVDGDVSHEIVVPLNFPAVQ